MLWYLAVIALIVILTYQMVARAIRHDLKKIHEVWAEIRSVLETRRRRIRQLLELLTYPQLSDTQVFQQCMLILDPSAKKKERNGPPSFVEEDALVFAVLAVIRHFQTEGPSYLEMSAVSDLFDRIRKYDDDELVRLAGAYDVLVRAFNRRFDHGLDRIVLWLMGVHRKPCPLFFRRLTPSQSSLAA